jgi:uncharacterized membrane protein YdfJ with MMPL/SSD domain
MRDRELAAWRQMIALARPGRRGASKARRRASGQTVRASPLRSVLSGSCVAAALLTGLLSGTPASAGAPAVPDPLLPGQVGR